MKPSDHLPILHPDDLSPEEAAFLAEDLKSLKAALRPVLADTKPQVRTRVVKYIHLLSHGTTHRQASVETGLAFSELGLLKAKNELLELIWKAAVASGERVRQEIREEALDKRGVKGWDEPVFHKGSQCGVIHRFSDKCLEIAVKGGDKTGKFKDREAAGDQATQIHYHIHGVPERGSTPPEKRIDADVTVLPSENATKTQPSSDNNDKSKENSA